MRIREVYYNTVMCKYLLLPADSTIPMDETPLESYEEDHLPFELLPAYVRDKLLLLNMLGVPERGSDKFLALEGVGASRWSLIPSRSHYIFYKFYWEKDG